MHYRSRNDDRSDPLQLKELAVIEVKIDAITEKVEKHNQVLERTYHLEQNMAVAKHDIESLKGKVA